MKAISNENKSNKQIVKNTGFVYLRLIISTFIGLISSRFVLRALGVSDYGLYNIVGALVALSTFITGALSSSTTRYLNYELGKGVSGNPRKVFNICNLIHILYALVGFIFAEVIGLIFIYKYLNVNPDKVNDALFVFHISTAATCLGIIGIPFQSLCIVHEKFKFYTITDILLSIVKFLLILLLLLSEGNTLRLYAIFMSSVTMLQAVIYVLYANKRWHDIVRWTFVRSFVDYKCIFRYINYDILGTLSLIARTQGSNVLINLFFGTITNAAYAISNTVMTYVNVFLGNFDTASAPQIIQNISSGNNERAYNLTIFTCRMCVLLMMVVYFPLMADLDLILYLWLGSNVPEGTNVLCSSALLVAVVSSTSGGLTQLINGHGNIKWFRIEHSILYLLCIPVGYYLYKIGYPVQSIFYLYVLADVINRFIQFVLLRRMYKFDYVLFLRKAYLRPTLIFLFLIMIVNMYKGSLPIEIQGRLLGILFILLLTIVLVFVVGFTYQERRIILNYIFKNK